MAATVTWHVVIDWHDTGEIKSSGSDYFDEAVYVTSLKTESGRHAWLQYSTGGASGFGRVSIGRAEFVLRNINRRFDPYNTASPLYGHLDKGKLVQIQVYVNETSTLYKIFTGRIRDMRMLEGQRDVSVEVEDLTAPLQTRTPSVEITSSVSYRDGIDALLIDAGWPSWAGGSLDSTSGSMGYFWAHERNSLETIHTLADACLGTFFVTGAGQARLINYERVYPAAKTWTADILLKDVALSNPSDYTIDGIMILGYPPYTGEKVTLWILPEIVSGENNVEQYFYLDFRWNGQRVLGLVDAVLYSDSLRAHLCTVSGGEGTPGYRPNRVDTAVVTAPGSGYSTWDILQIDDSYGEYAEVTVTSINGSGGVTGIALTNPGYGYLTAGEKTTTGGSGTGCKITITIFDGGILWVNRYDASAKSWGYSGVLRATPDIAGGAPPLFWNYLALSGTAIFNSLPTVVRSAATGDKLFVLDNVYIQSWARASTLLAYLETLFSESRRFARVKMEARPADQFAVDLFDPVFLDDVFGSDMQAVISYISHEWITPNGEAVRSTFGLEEYHIP